jgi:hypothetical protein
VGEKKKVRKRKRKPKRDPALSFYFSGIQSIFLMETRLVSHTPQYYIFQRQGERPESPKYIDRGVESRQRQNDS